MENVDRSHKACFRCSAWPSSSSLFGCAALVTALGCSGASAAINPAITINTLKTVTPSSIYTIGFQFVTDYDRKLEAIGVYNSTANDHSVGIWDASDMNAPTLVWSKNINSADCVLNSSYCWVTLTNGPDLIKDTLYMAASTWNNQAVPARLSMSDFSLTSGFQVRQAVNSYAGDVPSMIVDFSSNPDYAPNEITAPNAYGVFSVNLAFQAATPSSQVPAPLPLLGTATAFGWSRKIRRRIMTAG